MRTKEEQAAVEARLQALAEQNDGLLTPELVLKDARSKESPLHACFDWDKTKAAHNWWVSQARELIRSVRVMVTTERTSVSVVAYVRDPDLPGDQQGYRSTAAIRTDRERSRDVLVEEFTRAAGVLRRAREIALAFDMSGDIDVVVGEIEKLQTRVQVEVRAN